MAMFGNDVIDGWGKEVAPIMYRALRNVSAPSGSYTAAVKAYWEQVYKADVQRRLADCLEGRDKVRL